MSKFDIRSEFECQKYFECQNSIFGPNSKFKKDFGCQNAIFGPNSNVKLGFRMAKCNIRPEFECQNRISNGKIRYSARIRMSK